MDFAGSPESQGEEGAEVKGKRQRERAKDLRAQDWCSGHDSLPS